MACFFVIINNCNRTWLVVTAMLEDETENSFVWALKMIKKCMGDLTPNVVFTDSDLAMNSAINLEFLDSLHCLCIFYIDLNLKKNLRNKLGLSEFKEFPKYILASGYIKQQLDPFKYKWAICYTNNQFIAGTNSTQRVEGLNCKIHNCVRSNSSLLELTKKIQKLLDKESEYTRIEKYKEQIPMIGLSTISKTYFNSIENYNSFLMDSMAVDFIVQEQVNVDNVEGLIVACWYKDNFDDIWQQRPITIYTSSDQVHDQGSVEYPKYNRAQGVMRKALDMALMTNSYDEWMVFAMDLFWIKKTNK
ncbi:9910_t:CDS:2 [Gigaspora margarita]|uniref:9910_t:CDS:1 n=1 Tax=Gigaspora margarita TaxID=4874 RepID=A0ABN7V1D7_GIGMA|nr:9910_t:CDS:2 [Gigaspora margarita]